MNALVRHPVVLDGEILGPAETITVAAAMHPLKASATVLTMPAGLSIAEILDRAGAACGVSRLARFNITAEALAEGPSGKVTHFEGTPIPTSIVLVGLLSLAAWLGAVRESLWFGSVILGGFTLHPLVLLFALSGSLMISRIRIPKP